jgi:hypothetical protein
MPKRPTVRELEQKLDKLTESNEKIAATIKTASSRDTGVDQARIDLGLREDIAFVLAEVIALRKDLGN